MASQGISPLTGSALTGVPAPLPSLPREVKITSLALVILSMMALATSVVLLGLHFNGVPINRAMAIIQWTLIGGGATIVIAAGLSLTAFTVSRCQAASHRSPHQEGPSTSSNSQSSATTSRFRLCCFASTPPRPLDLRGLLCSLPMKRPAYKKWERQYFQRGIARDSTALYIVNLFLANIPMPIQARTNELLQQCSVPRRRMQLEFYMNPTRSLDTLIITCQPSRAELYIVGSINRHEFGEMNFKHWNIEGRAGSIDLTWDESSRRVIETRP